MPVQAEEGTGNGKPVFLKDHQVIDLGGTELECILTPGHSYGHLMFLDRKGRRLPHGLKNTPALFGKTEKTKILRVGKILKILLGLMLEIFIENASSI